VRWVEDGDHDLEPRQSSGRTRRQNWEEAVGEVAAFVERLGS
jgi:predicted alpha/beta-hydrolase family hydrolase